MHPPAFDTLTMKYEFNIIMSIFFLALVIMAGQKLLAGNTIPMDNININYAGIKLRYGNLWKIGIDGNKQPITQNSGYKPSDGKACNLLTGRS